MYLHVTGGVHNPITKTKLKVKPSHTSMENYLNRRVEQETGKMHFSHTTGLLGNGHAISNAVISCFFFVSFATADLPTLLFYVIQ